ncbi:MAG: molybdopterin converting factor [Planctomyces sp.]|nr:molybdopterin converting factor [Planctomyces sp.]
MARLTEQPIDTEELLQQVRTPAAGAVVLFLGTVREFTRGEQTVALDYEGFAPMALAEMERIEAEARAKWELKELSVVHRLGHLELGEASVAVAVSSAHRAAAFEAGQFVIDELKVRVPIWKKENWADGRTEWVHP